MVSPSICWLECERLVPAADRGLLLVHGRLLGIDGGDELGEVRFGTVFVRTAVIVVRVVLVPGVAAVGSGEAVCCRNAAALAPAWCACRG